jgi:hypothetical protein
MKYVDASAVLRVLFSEAGLTVPLVDGDRVVSSHLAQVETFRAVDRERLLGNIDDVQTATKRQELGNILAVLDLAPIDGTVIGHAKSSFAVNVRAGHGRVRLCGTRARQAVQGAAARLSIRTSCATSRRPSCCLRTSRGWTRCPEPCSRRHAPTPTSSHHR